jgi:hypothetical protein
MLDKNWRRACLLPDNYQRRVRQALAEQLGGKPETVAQPPSPLLATSTSDFDPISSSSQALAETDVAADSATRLEPEPQKDKKQEDEP